MNTNFTKLLQSILRACRRMWGACGAHVGRMWGAFARGLILKVYLWTLEGDHVKRFYNRKKEDKKKLKRSEKRGKL